MKSAKQTNGLPST